MKDGHTASSNEVQTLVKKLPDYFTENYHTCTKEIPSVLGQMYIADERFKNNINKNVDGTAVFISKATKIYCSK
ncbi:MAG: TipAS antibiotic-recognition domain-containing protein [Clostridia bacterium]|nr:TipAS antibiotic-recognition domain-containing protein [Clostridia bacterium]